MNNSQLINQDSGNCEWYTPIELTNAARLVMGSITLDPFSSDIANGRVGAQNYFKEKGFERGWFGNVWVNHPFSRDNNKKIFPKIISEYESGEITSCISICFAATSEKWFEQSLSYPQCYLHGRTNYYLPDGTKKKGVTKGSVITYFGNNLDQFARVFREFGTIKVKY